MSDTRMPEISPYDFLMGHRFATYRADGSVALHTDSEIQAMKAPEPWAYDNKKKKWIKKP